MLMVKYKNAGQIFFIFVLYNSFFAAPVLAGTSISEGKKLALEFCVACHQFADANQAGTLGPPLKAMKSRFPDRKIMYDIIYDPAAAINAHTMMPPFGRNKLITKEGINKIIDFLYSL